MAKARAYKNLEGKRRVLLELTGKEAVEVQSLLGRTYGPERQILGRVYSALDKVMELDMTRQQEMDTLVVGPVAPFAKWNEE